ncbi:GGDEF domain-containing protein [Gordonia malaquae]|uniref:GGDEF domain-containing protein n=1 Tax=Gordonia malaquae TaxID=410332 RepID=UPI0030FF2D47
MLDSTTLWAAIAAAAVVIGVLQVLQYLLQRDEVSMLLWGSAKLIGAVGAGLMAARGSIPDFVSVVIANALIVLAVTSNAAGMISFDGRRLPRWAIAAPPAVMTIGYLATPDIYTDIAAQTFINGICVIVTLSAAALHAHRANRIDRLVWRAGLAVALWLWVATMAARMTASVWTPAATDPQGSSGVQSVTALMLMILVVMTGVLEMLASRERVDHRLADAAVHDAQTGTLNRAGLQRRLAEFAGTDTGVAVMLMDLDDFKAVNDAFGHPVGDDVLEAFVTIVRRRLRPGDVLARYGGDEFCALLPGAATAEVTGIAEAIRAEFSRAHDGVATAVRCSVSIGAATDVPIGRVSFDDAVAVADASLYAAKKSGRDEVRTFTASPRAQASAPASPRADAQR